MAPANLDEKGTLFGLLIAVGIVIISIALGLTAGILMVRYVFPPPALLGGGLLEGTPVQIVAFLGVFLLTCGTSFFVGVALTEKRRRRG